MPRSQRGQDTHAKLLRAAEECFGTVGYAGTSVSEIARRAGVSQGGFYVYFPSKEAAFAELIREMSHQVRLVTREAIRDAKTRADAEVQGALAFFEWLRDHRYLHRILHEIDRVDESQAQGYFFSVSASYVEGLKAAMSNQEIDQVDPELLAYTLMGISHFISMRWILWTDGEFPDELAADFRKIITNLLGVRR